jgi:hypothetical protein
MPSPPGSNFVVHGTTSTGSQVAFGPFANLNTAQGVATDAMNDGQIIDYYITYVDVHGNNVTYEQV